MQYRSNSNVAQLIIQGYSLPGVREGKWDFVTRSGSGTVKACALGMAYIALVGDPVFAAMQYEQIGFLENPHRWLATRLNISYELASKISGWHVNGVSALDVAKMVNEHPQDYPPPDPPTPKKKRIKFFDWIYERRDQTSTVPVPIRQLEGAGVGRTGLNGLYRPYGGRRLGSF